MAMSRGRIEFYKEHYPRGTRVQLDSMGDDPNPVPNGTKGTVSFVDDIGTVFVNFDFVNITLHNFLKKNEFFGSPPKFTKRSGVNFGGDPVA